jgi:DNA repair exonuclease SbcCD ATPase subunit
MRSNLLTLAAARRQPEPKPKPDKTEILMEYMNGVMGYLKTDAKARAEIEAKPLIAQERAARQSEAEAERSKHEQAISEAKNTLRATEERMASLRSMYADSDSRAEKLAKEHETATKAIERIQKDHDRDQAKAQQQIQELNAKLATMPASVSEPSIALKPEQIQFEWRRGVAGLLDQVVMKADGFEDTAVNVERFPDNKIRGLSLRR